jgi:hypothetical protein
VLFEKLAKEFVIAKSNKLGCCSSIYLTLLKSFVNPIMLYNDKKSLEDVKAKHAKGEIETPHELEQIMLNDAYNHIKKAYDNVDGNGQLAVHLR